MGHSQRAHAILSASGAHRWMNCTPSARLEDAASSSGVELSSVYAREGTLAHELVELELQKHYSFIDKRDYNAELKRIKSHELYAGDMPAAVETMVQTVIEAEAEAQKRSDNQAVIHLESRTDFSHIVPGGFGTNDVSIIGDGILEIIDYKHGKGVRVFADDNPQLMLYALGELKKYDLAYDIKKVRMTIVQPRIEHYSTSLISVSSLLDWAENIAGPRAREAYRGEGEKQVGDWCKFCKIKAVCKAMADHNLALAKFEFADPDTLSMEELVPIFEQLPTLTDWASSVGKYLLEEALKGEEVPGYKVVEGRSVRRWQDEQAVIDTLKKKKFKQSDFLITKLGGIGVIEKLLGKAKFQELISEFVVKPPGKPALVQESDKRPAIMGIEQAKLDFKDDV